MIKAMGDMGFFGMNSGVDPEALPAGQMARAMNVITRGNVARTRPGYRSVYNAPSGHPQGITLFTPSGGKPHLVFACGGDVFVSPFPFVDYDVLPNVRFSPTSAQVVFQECEQTTDYDGDGNFFFKSQPRRVLVMQDGNTRAAFWDGSENRHLNPMPSSGEFTQPGLDETPVGLWMAWVSDRLIVFRNNLGFASDIGNPLKFTETQYLAESRAFTFPGPVTGAVQPYANLPLLVFTKNSLTRLRVDIRARSTWADLPDFQQTDYNIGCVGGKTIVRSFGQVWWMSEFGVTNFNAAMQLNNDSRFRYLDNEMAWSKQSLSPVMEWGAAMSFENYILFSVPFEDLKNRHTWVLDQMQSPEGAAAWCGAWEGTRPADWTSGDVNGKQRAFHLSLDGDGVNRVWEAFVDEHDDNGCPITAYVETRLYNDGNKVNKQYLNSKLFWDEIGGTVDYAIAVGATRGGYTRVGGSRIMAADGVLGDEVEEDEIADVLPQQRTHRTQRIDRIGDCTSCGTESDLPDNVDCAFQHLVVWSGDAVLKGVQMFYEADTGLTEFEPDCAADETEEKVVSGGGCGGGTFVDGVFSAEHTIEVELECEIGPFTETVTVTDESKISELDAERKAACRAQHEANSVNCPSSMIFV